MYDEAYTLISIYSQENQSPYPMALYCRGWYAAQLGNREQAQKSFALAAMQSPDFCFPNRPEEVAVLQKALELNPTDANAYYLLGNYYYAFKCYDNAIKSWESGQAKKHDHAGLARNLALAYFNKLGKEEEALKQMEHAFALDAIDARLLMELDQLYKRLNRPYQERLDFLEKHRRHGAQENDIFYWLGCAYDALDRNEEANAFWERAAMGLSEPSPAMYYNDQQPDNMFYQGLALRKLGKENEATSRFQKLCDYGDKHIDDEIKIDYFAVSLPDMLIWEDDLNKRKELFCKYLIGLGAFGLGNKMQARENFEHVLASDRYHAGALVHLEFVEKFADL